MGEKMETKEIDEKTKARETRCEHIGIKNGRKKPKALACGKKTLSRVKKSQEKNGEKTKQTFFFLFFVSRTISITTICLFTDYISFF